MFVNKETTYLLTYLLTYLARCPEWRIVYTGLSCFSQFTQGLNSAGSCRITDPTPPSWDPAPLLGIRYPVLLSRSFFKSWDRDRDLDKMNSSALESRDHGTQYLLEIYQYAYWNISTTWNDRLLLSKRFSCRQIVALCIMSLLSDDRNFILGFLFFRDPAPASLSE